MPAWATNSPNAGIVVDQTQTLDQNRADGAFEAVGFDGAANLGGGELRGMKQRHLHSVEAAFFDERQERRHGLVVPRRPDESVNAEFHVPKAYQLSRTALTVMAAL